MYENAILIYSGIVGFVTLRGSPELMIMLRLAHHSLEHPTMYIYEQNAIAVDRNSDAEHQSVAANSSMNRGWKG